MDNKYIATFLGLHGVMFALLAFVDIFPALNSDLSTYKPMIGWTGSSWVLSSVLDDQTLVTAALIGYILSAIMFLISGIIFNGDSHFWRVAILISCIFSSIVLLIFWDGSLANIIQKGGIGFVLNIVIAIFVNHK